MFKHVIKEQLKVPARIDYLKELRDFVTKIGKRYGFSERVVNAFRLSIDEAATNIIRHAYRDWEGDLTMRVIVKKGSMTVILIDQGKYFDPRKVQDPDLQRYVDIGKKGGLGIFIMRRLLDDIDYRKTEEGNELWLTKKRDVPRKRKLSVPTIPLPLKTRYWFYSVGLITVLLVFVYTFFFFQQKRIIQKDYLSQANSACLDLANNFSGVLTSTEKKQLGTTGSLNDFEIVEKANRTMRLLEKSVFKNIMVNAFLVDKDDKVLATTDENIFDILDSFNLPENKSTVEKNIYRFKNQNGKDIYNIIWPIQENGSGEISRIYFQLDYDLVKSKISKSRVRYLNMSLLIWGLSASGLFLLIYLVMNPFRHLAEWVRALSQPGVMEEMDIDASSEVGEIAKAFSDITSKLKDSQKNMAEQERLQKEMQVAQEIQQTLLPSEFPEVEGYEIASFYAAAKEVGGDYFDFVEVDKDTLGIVVADVSGKGVPGSLVMTMIRTALRTEARGVKDAAEVLAKVNDFVVNDMKKGMFVTLFYVIIDSKKRKLNYASAGHNPMILYRANTNNTYYLNPRGFPIGISLPDPSLFRKSIESDTIALAEDDILIIYTDGVTEAMNDSRQLFGEERYLNVIRQNGHLPSKVFVEKLNGELDSFTQGTSQNDDITLVAIKEETSADKVELKRAQTAFKLIQEGSAITKACRKAGLSVYAYTTKYREVFEKEGIESYEIDSDTEQIEAKHLSIEEKTKIYDIIRRYPAYGAKRISEELNTEHYGNTKINVSKIYEELVRARLNTKELREAFVSRGGRKKRIKPPGTPLLTIDGKVILQNDLYEESSKQKEKSAQRVSPHEGKVKDKEIDKIKLNDTCTISDKKTKQPQKSATIETSDIVTKPVEDLLDKRAVNANPDVPVEEKNDGEADQLSMDMDEIFDFAGGEDISVSEKSSDSSTATQDKDGEKVLVDRESDDISFEYAEGEKTLLSEETRTEKSEKNVQDDDVFDEDDSVFEYASGEPPTRPENQEEKENGYAEKTNQDPGEEDATEQDYSADDESQDFENQDTLGDDVPVEKEGDVDLEEDELAFSYASGSEFSVKDEKEEESKEEELTEKSAGLEDNIISFEYATGQEIPIKVNLEITREESQENSKLDAEIENVIDYFDYASGKDGLLIEDQKTESTADQSEESEKGEPDSPAEQKSDEKKTSEIESIKKSSEKKEEKAEIIKEKEIISIISDEKLTDTDNKDEESKRDNTPIDERDAPELDILSSPEKYEKSDEDELDFAELIEEGGGLDEPESKPKEKLFEGQSIEDAEIISEENANDIFLNPDLKEPFEEFLEIEDEKGLVTPEGEVDDFVAEKILKEHLRTRLNKDKDESQIDLNVPQKWDIKEPDLSAKKKSSPEQENQKLTFDELMDIIDSDPSFAETSSTIKSNFEFGKNQKQNQKQDKKKISEEKDLVVREKEMKNAIKLYKQENYIEAITEFKRLVKKYPDDIQIHSLLGNTYFKSKKLKEAERQYERVLSLDSKNVDAYENLGVVCASNGDLKRAIKCWEQILQVTPHKNDIRGHIERAKLYLKKT